MILDEVLLEEEKFNSLTEEQKAYIQAYIEGYTAALESYIKDIEESHAIFNDTKALKKVGNHIQDKINKARKDLNDAKKIDGVGVEQYKQLKEKFNKADKLKRMFKARVDAERKSKLASA